MVNFIVAYVIPLLAAVVCWQLVLHTVPARTVALLKEPAMSDPHQGPRGLQGIQGERGPRGKREPASRVFIILMVAAGMVLSIGVMAWRRDVEREHTEKCIQTWADDYKATTDLRVNANADLRTAEKAWVGAVGDIFYLFIDLVANPTPPGEEPDPVAVKKISDVLNAFAVADRDLTREQENVDKVSEKHAYPALDLNCEVSDD